MVTLILIAATPAEAKPLKLGKAYGFETAAAVIPAAGTFVPTSYSEPDELLRAPVSGTIVQWEVGQAEGIFALHVVEIGADGKVSIVSSSAPGIVPELNLGTFPTALPIKAGQSLALDVSANSQLGFVERPGAAYDYFVPAPASGVATAPSGVAPYEFDFVADLQRPPTITFTTAHISIPSEQVRIQGTELMNVTSVKFGGIPAPSFESFKEGELGAGTLIIATPPPRARPGAVNVTVTTAAGSSKPGPRSRLRYRACRVPMLGGKTIEAARRALRRAHCRVGQVRPRGADRFARVIGQNIRPGTLKPDGAHVRLRVAG